MKLKKNFVMDKGSERTGTDLGNGLTAQRGHVLPHNNLPLRCDSERLSDVAVIPTKR